jgi:hypothetical protein
MSFFFYFLQKVRGGADYAPPCPQAYMCRKTSEIWNYKESVPSLESCWCEQHATVGVLIILT